MAKIMTNAMIDGGLTAMSACTRISVLSAEPASIADITTTYMLATTSLTGGDFTIADGDVSGRKDTVAQKASVPISFEGAATHVAIDDGTDYIVTTCTSQMLYAGGTVTIPAWKREIADPT